MTYVVFSTPHLPAPLVRTPTTASGLAVQPILIRLFNAGGIVTGNIEPRPLVGQLYPRGILRQ